MSDTEEQHENNSEPGSPPGEQGDSGAAELKEEGEVPTEGAAKDHTSEENDEEGEEGEDEEGSMVVDFVDFEHGEAILKEELKKIQVKAPEIEEDIDEGPPMLVPEHFPPSYHDNDVKERRVIRMCKRFLKHYNHLFDNRKPLFLKPKNEFDVEKLVCTTIVPTQLPYKNMMNWSEIASYVATYLVYTKLKYPMDLPETLFSPQTVLSTKRGHCFELSTLLCSMLIGSGYDAFVVSGYATREVANRDSSYTKCPLIEDDVIVYPKPITLKIQRYTVRPPRWNKSEYLLRMKMKKNAQVQAENLYVSKTMSQQKKLDESPPEDELRGWRIHSWVLVLDGQRDIKESFFIEPTLGVSHPLDWEGYIGVESLWNHYNYYVNVQQDHPSTMEGMRWDIGDSRDWEYLVPLQDLHVTLSKSETFLLEQKTKKEGDQFDEMRYDLPFSWSLPLKLSRAEYDFRHPNGKTSRRYYKSKVHYFAPYLHPEGLVTNVTVYFDLDCQELYYAQDYYEKRSDLLCKKFTHFPSGKVIEYFQDGREDVLKEHQYILHSPGPETPRRLQFWKNRRTDGLYIREESANFLKEWYEGRDDNKIYMEAIFGPHGCLYERGLWPDARPIETVVEQYSRNKWVPANQDIAKVSFSVGTDEIDVEYHIEKERLYGSTRHYTKPDKWWDPSYYLDWRIDLHYEFQANVYAKPMCELALFQLMIKLMKIEEKSRAQIRISEKETKKLLQIRMNDVAKLKLVMTYVDADIIPSIRVARLAEKARLRAILLSKKSDVLKDYLTPYLQRFGLSKINNKKQALRVTEALMADLRDRLLTTARHLKEQYEQAKVEIRDMQMVHSINFSFLSLAEMDVYKEKLMIKLFKAHLLGERLLEMKSYSLVKYRALYDQIKADQRMTGYV